MWVRPHTGRQFTYIRVAESDRDGSGRNPHLHLLLHLLTKRHRDELQAALTNLYGRTTAGRLVAKLCAGFEATRHASGYCGSTFAYITKHKTQQAYVAGGGNTWRASRRDENGRHVGLKSPFVGKRWVTSRNINAKARQSYGGSIIADKAVNRIAAERKNLAA
jgi:hypothetical protein